MIKKWYKTLVPEQSRIAIRKSLLRLRYPFYLGDNKECVCCKKSFSKFLPKGNIPRDQAMCPYCFSLERTRLLYLYLTEELNIFQQEGTRILHFAPEEAISIHLKKHFGDDYIDADINPAVATYAMDITDITLEDNSIDLIICSHVLGHVPDEVKALSEMKRVLNTGGKIIFLSLMDLNLLHTLEDSTIITPAQRLKAYGEHDLCRLYGMDFSERMITAGFAVEHIDYRKLRSADERDRYSLGDGSREQIYIAQHA